MRRRRYRRAAAAYFNVMDKSTSFAVWREFACASILETLNNSLFPKR